MTDTVRRVLTRWYVVAVLGLLLVACGGGGRDTSPTADRFVPGGQTATVLVITATAAPQASVTPLATPTSTATSTATLTPLPTATLDPAVNAALKAALLALDDLAPGFRELEPIPTTGDTGPCGHPDFARSGAKLGEAEVRYQASELGPFVLQNLVLFHDQDARDAFDYAKTSLDCTEWTEPDATGIPMTFRVEPLDTRSFGDASFAVRVELDVADVGTLVNDTLFIRVGGLLTILSYATVDDPDIGTLTILAERAVEKLRTAHIP
ncbi:MAG: hypothetical protein DCC58_19920 [Chloroflexi bacterium]|nr:MAG: hypothetical protein DCC58_19920 [Chloroflexota bacterium]